MLTKQLVKAKEKQSSRQNCARDYAELFSMPTLQKNDYLVTYTDNKGNENKGVISYAGLYDYSPSTTSFYVTIYDLETYSKANGEVSSRDVLDNKNIQGFELYNDRYEKVKYSDPTVLTIGGTEEFMLVLLKGDLNLYAYYSLDGVSYVIEKGKKAQIIYNYSKLADFMEDKPEVAEKVKSGHYTDKAIKETSSKLERFVQQGTHNDISIEAVTRMVSDYNSL